MGDINLNEYMTFNCVWEKYKGESELTSMPVYEAPVNIKCFKYGKSLFVRDTAEGGKVNAQTYLVNENVSVRDKLDGQVIKDRAEYPMDFTPDRIFYECYTW